MNDAPNCRCPTCKQPVPPSGVYVDLLGNKVTAGGVTVKLTPRNTEIMSLLASRMPSGIERETLRGKLRGESAKETGDYLMHSHICLLRKAIKDLPLKVETQWGHGWRLAWKEAA